MTISPDNIIVNLVSINQKILLLFQMGNTTITDEVLSLISERKVKENINLLKYTETNSIFSLSAGNYYYKYCFLEYFIFNEFI